MMTNIETCSCKLFVNPDEKRHEGKALGLLYTAASRATILGDDDGQHSAIYFTGKHFKKSCIMNLHQKQNSVVNYQLFTDQQCWTTYLHRKEKTTIREYTNKK